MRAAHPKGRNAVEDPSAAAGCDGLLMPADSDRASSAEVSANDPQRSLELLYRSHAPTLQRRLAARLGSAEEASDLINEAFARLLGARARQRLREPGAFLNRIVRNLLIDRSRRRDARPPHVPFELAADIGVRPDQGDAIELEQLRDRYRQAVSALPERMRHVFILHRLEGLAYKEIAALLDISVRTVEWHIAEAIVRIGRGLDGE